MRWWSTTPPPRWRPLGRGGCCATRAISGCGCSTAATPPGSLQGLPVTTDEPNPKPGDFIAEAGHLPLLDTNDAATLAGHGVLLDCRAAERYRGENEPVDPVAGHIPGARSLPTDGNVDRTDASSAGRRWALALPQVGRSRGWRIRAYCGSGVTAAHTVLALELAGLHGALYAGSGANGSPIPRVRWRPAPTLQVHRVPVPRRLKPEAYRAAAGLPTARRTMRRRSPHGRGRRSRSRDTHLGRPLDP